VSYPGYDTPAGLALADVNGDKRTDVIMVHNAADEREAPAIGDLNGDGKPDVAMTAGADGIAIFYGK
jgi:hypothetical protein